MLNIEYLGTRKHEKLTWTMHVRFVSKK